jgi:hypothetical protein
MSSSSSSSLLQRLADAPGVLARAARALLSPSGGPARWRLLYAALGAFLALETYKGWPLSYHVRLFALLFRYRLFPRRLVTLDTPIVSHSQVRLSDIDYHGHLNNGQYALGEFQHAARGRGGASWARGPASSSALTRVRRARHARCDFDAPGSAR